MLPCIVHVTSLVLNSSEANSAHNQNSTISSILGRIRKGYKVVSCRVDSSLQKLYICCFQNRSRFEDISKNAYPSLESPIVMIVASLLNTSPIATTITITTTTASAAISSKKQHLNGVSTPQISIYSKTRDISNRTYMRYL